MLSSRWNGARVALGLLLASCASMRGAELFFIQQQFAAPDPSAGDAFGHGIAVSGNTAIAGAPGATGGGAVYSFGRNGGDWFPEQRIIPLDRTDGDKFGWAV